MIPGEMYWVEFPPSDGHEQAGRRPAIFLQDDTYAGGLSVALMVPVTGQPANLRFAGTVGVMPTPQNGLLKQSVALVFQARAIDRKRIRNRIGVVEPKTLIEIHEALDRLTGRVRVPPPPSVQQP